MNRYRDFNGYLREIFGERVQKIPLDAGLTCPNRDGTISGEGCIFCDGRGSGTGAMINEGLSIDEQMVRGRQFAEKRYGAKKFIAYFQSFTNTYAPLERLKDLYDQALKHPGVVGLSVATRPDCVGDDVLELLSTYRKDHLVWIEYGLQSAHDVTLSKINRGHDVACFERGVRMADKQGLNVCTHIILGLPGESRDMMLETARFLSVLPIKGVKIHLLYVVKGTPLASLYQKKTLSSSKKKTLSSPKKKTLSSPKKNFQCLERDVYIERVVDVLERLRPDIIIHRLTGDPVGEELVAPLWAKQKTENLNLIRKRLEERDTWQGMKYQTSTAGK